jgi:hypothetical protein
MTDGQSDRCPECDSTNVARIVYGYPAGERSGENVVYGGCMCWGDERDPQLACQDCGLRFGQVVPLPLSPL